MIYASRDAGCMCRAFLSLILVAELVAYVIFKLDTIFKIIDKPQRISIRYLSQSKPLTYNFAQSLFVLIFFSRSGILYRIFWGEPVCVRYVVHRCRDLLCCLIRA